jgi:hypothetical protein
LRPIDQQIAVADAGDELQPIAVVLVLGEFFLGGGQQFAGFFRRDVPGREIAHRLIFDRDQVAANGPIVLAQRNALRRGFQRRPAGEMFQRVVAEQTEIGHVGAGGQRRGHVVRTADDALRRHGVHLRHVRRFERGASAERTLRLVGAPVGNDDRVFHASNL